MFRDAWEAPPEDEQDAGLFFTACVSAFFHEDITHAITSLRGLPVCPAWRHGFQVPTGPGRHRRNLAKPNTTITKIGIGKAGMPSSPGNL